jgi:hypothetical protein
MLILLQALLAAAAWCLQTMYKYAAVLMQQIAPGGAQLRLATVACCPVLGAAANCQRLVDAACRPAACCCSAAVMGQAIDARLQLPASIPAAACAGCSAVGPPLFGWPLYSVLTQHLQLGTAGLEWSETQKDGRLQHHMCGWCVSASLHDAALLQWQLLLP